MISSEEFGIIKIAPAAAAATKKTSAPIMKFVRRCRAALCFGDPQHRLYFLLLPHGHGSFTRTRALDAISHFPFQQPSRLLFTGFSALIIPRA